MIVEAEKIVNTSHIFSKLLSRMKKKKKCEEVSVHFAEMNKEQFWAPLRIPPLPADEAWNLELRSLTLWQVSDPFLEVNFDTRRKEKNPLNVRYQPI